MGQIKPPKSKVSDNSRLKDLGYELEDGEQLWGVAAKSEVPSEIYDNDGLSLKLADIKYPVPDGLRRIPWIETLSITSEPNPKGTEIGANDDIKREEYFIELTRSAVPVALTRLRAYNLKFSRPLDYLAEMFKTDAHMAKVKAQTIEEQRRQAQFEQRKNQRLDKKFNKLAGHQIVREQNEARKRNEMLKKIDAWKAERKSGTKKDAEEAFDAWLVSEESGNKNGPKRSTGKKDRHGNKGPKNAGKGRTGGPKNFSKGKTGGPKKNFGKKGGPKSSTKGGKGAIKHIKKKVHKR